MDPHSVLDSTHVHSHLPVLIVDKKGFIGKGLARLLRAELLIVLVTAEEVENHDNVIHIPYERKIPIIPDNQYAQLYVVYNGEKEVLEMLSSFLKKAEESGAKVLFITSITHSSQKLFAVLQKQTSPLLHVFVYGETFSDRNPESNEINLIIHQAKVYGRIEIPNAGLEKLYPVLLDDVLIAIKDVAFATNTTNRLSYIFPTYPFTQIAIARMLQQHAPLIKIDFKKKKHHPKAYYVPGGGAYVYPSYDLEKKLNAINLAPVHEIRRISQRKHPIKVEDPQAKQRRVVILLTLLFSLFIAPIIVTFTLAVCGAGFASLSLKEAEAGKLDRAQQSAVLAAYSLKATQVLIPGLVLPSLFLPNQTEQFLQNITTGISVVDVEQDGLSSMQLLKQIYNQQSANPKGDFLQALATMKNTLLTYQKMKAENILPKSVYDKMQKYTGVLQLVEGTIDTWPTLLGFEGKKTYLVLFQNNMELRPGGGFIGSYGIVSVQNGIFGKLQIADVYDADGKLAQHIEPPYGLRKYIGSAHWFLRDSNFEVDFTKNAQQAKKFLQLETGQTVDGVVAIDTTFLKNILAVLGSVNVSDYNQVVTPDNFYLLTQTHVQKDFFPGSTQKKDFLRSLMAAMMEKFFVEKHFSYDTLLQTIESSMRSKHLMFAFSDEGIQNVFTVNGLSSSLKEGRAMEKNTYLDFLSVIDANVGANKANYYVKRSITHDVRFESSGGLQETAEVILNNTSSKSSPFGGDYKDYIRFLLPANAILQNVFIDDKDQGITAAITDPAVFISPTFVPPVGLEVDQSVISGRSEVGFLIIVPVNTSKKVTISYRIPDVTLGDEAALTYKLLVFKQPGTDADPYRLTFAYPSEFQVVKTDAAAVDLGGKFILDSDLATDKNISVVLSKK